MGYSRIPGLDVLMPTPAHFQMFYVAIFIGYLDPGNVLLDKKNK